MTQEEKDLLLKDLCARLPYRVKCNMNDRGVNIIGTLSSYRPLTDGSLLFGICDKKYVAPDKYWQPNAMYSVEKVKPYLRSMSSMSREEEEKYDNLLMTINDGCENTDYMPYSCMEYVDWLNAHHFDYRGLIEMGLALEAPEDMYDNKK